jgi:hypothetical protein
MASKEVETVLSDCLSKNRGPDQDKARNGLFPGRAGSHRWPQTSLQICGQHRTFLIFLIILKVFVESAADLW